MQHNSHSAYPVSLGDDLRRQYALAGVAPEAGAQRIVAIDAASTSARIAPHVNVCQSRQSRQRPINAVARLKIAGGCNVDVVVQTVPASPSSWMSPLFIASRV
uniref:Uncharacterized protein n=1 Tax=Leptocylindrus danicus TaxID=163516 RepID=A0A7S2KLZ3_9STRA|mmetsp:Transcript_23648/g.35498  ORF Transcript_23648/g.35498 Transcript_23648/m.35498 type:complete len:103 (+) Transcript_23648:197-505(+)